VIAAGKLAVMLVRVDPELNVALAALAGRLFQETQLEHSHAAIVRGLVAIALASITDAASLAPLFVGVRVPPGRKVGTQKKRTAEAPGDVDLAHAAEAADEERSGGRGRERAMRTPRFSLSEQEQASAESLLVAMRIAAPPGAWLTVSTVIHAALVRGFAALALEVNAAPKHWASLDNEDHDAPPESSEQPRRVSARLAPVVQLRPSSRDSIAPAEVLAAAETIATARALVALAGEAGIVRAEERAAFEARLVPGVLVSTVRALALELAMAAPIGSAVDRAGRTLLAELPRGTR
jgi:hypothetical protein